MTQEDIAVKLAEHDEKLHRCKGRIEKLEKETDVLHKLATSVELMAQQSKQTNAKIDALSADVNSLKAEPKKKWDLLVSGLISAAVGLVLGFLFNAIVG